MSYIPLMIQGGLVGFLAGQAFPDHGVGFWATIVVNAMLTVLYGTFRASEK